MVRAACLICMLAYGASAQNSMDNWLAQQELSTNEIQRLEMLWDDLQNQKIAINFCSRQDLMEIGFLDVFQIHNLMVYREQSGLIYSPAELSLIKGFDPKLLELLLPLLDFSIEPTRPKLAPSHLLRYASYEVLGRFQIRNSSLNMNHLGDPLESRWRFRVKTRAGINLGLNLQKDPGEAWRGALGFDHASFFIQYSGYTALRQIIIGDFQFNGALGLNLWSGMRFSQTSLDQPFQIAGKGLQAFAGNEEERFFRGLALAYQWQSWHIQSFFSRRNLDARSEEQDGEIRFKPIEGGYHRTEKELSQKDNLGLLSGGLQIAFENSFMRSGLLLHAHQFSEATLTPENFQEEWNPVHSSYRNGSFFAQAQIRSVHASIEWAFDQDWHQAFQFKGESRLGDRLRIGQSFRYFAPRYQSLWNAPDAAKGSLGELGGVLQLRFNWSYPHRSLLEYENYFIPWPQFNWEGPFKRREITLVHRWQRSSNQFTLRVQYRQDSGFDQTENQSELQLKSEQYLRARCLLNHQVSRNISSRTSLQWIVNPDLLNDWGLLMHQRWMINAGPNYRFIWHCSLSSIPANLGALYEYESDLRLGFSIPSFRGSSFRTALIGRWSAEPFQIELKAVLQENLESDNSVYEFKIQCGLKL